MNRALIPALLLSLAACGQSGEPDIQLSGSWARPTRGDTPGAVYVTIDNKGGAGDQLTGASSDRAATAMVHRSETVDDVATMRMAGAIDIPAGGRIEMAPGGTHVMLEGLKAPLNSGDRFDLVLKFRKSGDRRIRVEVARADQP